MQITLSGAALTHLPQERRFALAAAAGFDGIELVITPELWRRGAAYACALSEKYELPILTLHPPMERMFGWNSNDWYVNSMQLAIQIPTCRLMVLHTPDTAFWESGQGRWYMESIRRCRAMSDRVRLSIETANADIRNPEGSGRHDPLLTHYEEMRRFVEKEQLSVTFDTCHASTMPEGMMAAYTILRPYITNIHFSDMRDETRLPVFVSRIRRVRRFLLRHYTPGKGALPLEAFVRTLVKDGYSETLTFEETPLAMPFWNSRAVLEHLRTTVAYWRRVIAAAPTLHTEAVDS